MYLGFTEHPFTFGDGAYAVLPQPDAGVTVVGMQNRDTRLYVERRTANGTVLWKTSPAVSVRAVIGASTDLGGNTYVLDRDQSVFKFSSTGVLLWRTPPIYMGAPPVVPREQTLAVAPDGSVYSIRFNDGGYNHQRGMRLVKFSADGELAWSFFYNGPVVDGEESSVGVRLGGNGRVYLFGVAPTQVPGATDSHVTILGMTTEGIHEWTAQYSDPLSLGSSIGHAKVDAGGNLLIAGVTGQWDYARGILMRVRPDGSVDWQVKSAHTSDHGFQRLDFHADGDIILAGQISEGFQAVRRLVMERRSSDGALKWSGVAPYGAYPFLQLNALNGLVATPDGKSYCAVAFGRRLAIIQADEVGAFSTTDWFGPEIAGSDRFTDLRLSPDGALYASGLIFCGSDIVQSFVSRYGAQRLVQDAELIKESTYRGVKQSGTFQSLQYSDDNRLVISIGPVLSRSNDPPVQMELLGLSPSASPTVMKFNVEAVCPSGATVNVRALNFVTFQYELIGSHPVSGAEVRHEFTYAGNLSRFVGDSTREITVRVEFVPNQALGRSWNVGIDRFHWSIRP
jgi:hypothetical protein